MNRLNVPDTAEALRLADLLEARREECPTDAETDQVMPDASAMLRSLVAEVERLCTHAAKLDHQLIKFEAELSAVMPDDFKDWHDADKSEWPALAASVILSQREQRDLGWEQAEKWSDEVRRWHQKPGTVHSHYDIAMSKRALAVAAGAVEITMSQLGRVIRAKREAAIANQKSSDSPA